MLKVGNRFHTYDFDQLPAGTLLKVIDRETCEVTELPQVNEVEQLAMQLFKVRYPSSSSEWWEQEAPTTIRASWIEIARYVLDNFERKTSAAERSAQESEQQSESLDAPISMLPKVLIDGDGDRWYLKRNDQYTTVREYDDGFRTLENIRRMYGIKSRIAA